MPSPAWISGSPARKNGFVASSIAIVDRKREFPGLALPCGFRRALFQNCVRGIDGERESRIGDGVFMPAIDLCFARESGKFHQRMKQHRRGLLEGAPATHRKERIPGKKDVFACEPIGDMAGRVSRNLDNLGFERPRHDAVIFVNREIEAADLSGLLGRADDTGMGKSCLKSGDPLNMIEMVMGDQNVCQIPFPCRERGQDRGGIGRVDRRRGAGRGIVDEDAKLSLRHRNWWIWAAILRLSLKVELRVGPLGRKLMLAMARNSHGTLSASLLSASSVPENPCRESRLYFHAREADYPAPDTLCLKSISLKKLPGFFHKDML